MAAGRWRRPGCSSCSARPAGWLTLTGVHPNFVEAVNRQETVGRR